MWALLAAAWAAPGDALVEEHCMGDVVFEEPLAEVHGGRLYWVGCHLNMAGHTSYPVLLRWVGPGGDEVWSDAGGAMDRGARWVHVDGDRVTWTASGERRYDTRPTTVRFEGRIDPVSHQVTGTSTTWVGPAAMAPARRAALVADADPTARWVGLYPPWADGIVDVDPAHLTAWTTVRASVLAERKEGRGLRAAVRALAHLPKEIDLEGVPEAEHPRAVELVNDLAFVASEALPRAAIEPLWQVVGLAPKREVAWLNLADALWACGDEHASDAYRDYLAVAAKPVDRAVVRWKGEAEPPGGCPVDAAALRVLQQEGLAAGDAERVVGVARAQSRALDEDLAVVELLWRLRARRPGRDEADWVEAYLPDRRLVVPETWPPGWDLWFATRWSTARPWAELVAAVDEGPSGQLVVRRFADAPDATVHPARGVGARTMVAPLARTTGGWCGLSRRGGLWCEGAGEAVEQAPFGGSWVDLAVEGERVCAVRAEGGAACWGDGGPLELPGVVDVWLGPDGARCLLMATGALDCVGVETVPDVSSYPQGLDVPSVMHATQRYRPRVGP